MRLTFLSALAMGAIAALAAAQEPAPPAAAPAAKSEARTPRMAVIDMQRISGESALGKAYTARIDALRNEIDAEGTKKQAELQKLDAAIKALQDELEKQAGVLSQEAADRKRQDIVRKSRERQAFLEDGQAELQRMRERAQQQAQALNQEFQEKIKPFVEAVAKEKGLDILLDNAVALAVSKDFDITREVIVKADEAEKAARAKAPAAAKPAPAAPAASAPASPAPAPAPTPTPSPQQR
jgi:Skp family chaperone for outer membrane proteins